MRIRTVKPEMWEDEKVACLSRDARLMLIGCFNLADDEGLLRWTPAFIKSGLFMYDDDLGLDEVKSLMSEVTNQGIVLAYSPQAGKGTVKQQLGWIVNFRKHQKINRPQPSKLSPPSIQNRSVQDAYASRDGYVCHLCGGPVNETRYIPSDDPYSSAPLPPGGECLNASLDHIKPRTKGGGDHPTNIALAHVGCNKGRRERPISEFAVPLSVRSALVSIGWVSDHDVTNSMSDAVSHSVNESLLEEEGEEEGDQGREQERTSSDPDGSDHRSDYPHAFEEWWKLYPRKDAKRKALEAWRRARKRATDQELNDAALRYAQDPNRQEQFTKQPATWLNGDCWLSDALPATAPLLRAVGSPVDDKVNGWLELANSPGRELE